MNALALNSAMFNGARVFGPALAGVLIGFVGVAGCLFVNGFSYLALSFTGLLLPQYEHMLSNITFPAILGEMAIMLWLLIKGAEPQPLDSAASSAAG